MNRTEPHAGRLRRHALAAAAIAIVALSSTPQAGQGIKDTPKGTVWVVNRDLGQLAIFDAATGELLATRPVGTGAHDICISEQNHKAYITAEMDNARSE